MKVLVVGGSGYLGQHLVLFLSRQGHKVRFTYKSTEAKELQELASDNPVRAIQVDLVTGDGLEAAWTKGGLDAVINCAALSQPKACEENEEGAAAVNVPTRLMEACERQRDELGQSPLLIHISTDQVYDGSSKEGGMWTEDDATEPINAYGRSKLAAEKAIQERWANHVILRASVIYGPQPPSPVGRPLFLQFVEGRLREGLPTEFFEDEYRSPVYVTDIAETVSMILARASMSNHAPLAEEMGGPCLPLGFSRLFNLGGPQRLSRLEMASIVARTFSYSDEALVPSTSGAVDRGYASPADISMDVTRLSSELKVPLTPFQDALRKIYNLPEPRPEEESCRGGEDAGS